MSRIESLEEVKELIAQGVLNENYAENIELKRSWNESHGQKISMLSNRLKLSISFLIVGVEDDGKLAGHSEKWVSQNEEIISQHINKNLDPVQACQRVICEKINGSFIIIIEIKNPGTVVYWNYKAYKGSGTTLLEMKPDEIMELTIMLPGMTDYTKQKWTGKKNTVLVNYFVQNLLEKRSDIPFNTEERDQEQILQYLKINNNNVSRILFGDTPYRVVFYDKHGDPIINETYFGLYSILHKSFINKIQEWTIEQNNDRDSFYPEKALSEGLANAVAHAAYFESNGDIIIEVYKNKLHISNLCLPECGYFANKWFSRSHRTINELLMETLRLVGIVDELGRGKNLIFTESIKFGKKPPVVSIENAGRYNRWVLVINSGTTDNKQVRLLSKLREKYPNESKALIANALVLWHRKSVAEIRNYIDGESAYLFAEILSDLNGPIFYSKKEERIILNRWVRVLLDEGKESKALTEAEELALYEFAYDMQMKYDNGIITPKILRQYANMADSNSERTLSSSIIKKWLAERKLESVKKGVYRFKRKLFDKATYKQILELLSKNNNE